MGKKANKKIGLALGSGAARGLAHIGVLKALEEENIPVDMIAGSSMGALVGACFAKGKGVKDFEDIVLETDWKKLLKLADPNLALMLKGFVHGNKVKELLRAIIGDIEFKDLKIPLSVVATDINTGEEIIIKEGSVIEAVRASISMPAIFMPVKLKDKFLVDGGIVNPIPVKVVRGMGADFVIACNVIHKPHERKPAKTKKKQKRLSLFSGLRISAKAYSGTIPSLVLLNNRINKLIRENKDIFDNFQKLINTFRIKLHKGQQKIDPAMPGIFDVIFKALYAMEYEIAKMKASEADIVIVPKIGHIAALEFYKGPEAIEKGYEEVKKAMPKIQRLISKSRWKRIINK